MRGLGPAAYDRHQAGQARCPAAFDRHQAGQARCNTAFDRHQAGQAWCPTALDSHQPGEARCPTAFDRHRAGQTRCSFACSTLTRALSIRLPAFAEHAFDDPPALAPLAGHRSCATTCRASDGVLP
eukprot:363916-Chlamydomonas_euryale.AAC.1